MVPDYRAINEETGIKPLRRFAENPLFCRQQVFYRDPTPNGKQPGNQSMPQPSEIIDSVDTDEGKLELIRQASGHWVIAIDHRPLMSSFLHRSEVALADLACSPLAEKTSPRVLVGGLGMGYTLRAALDLLPADAEVVTAEINPVVAGWCRGPIAELSKNALDDPRVKLEILDVSILISRAAEAPEEEKFDSLVLDLYEGPYPPPKGTEDLVYGRKGLQRARLALRPGGCMAVWSEGPVKTFEKLMGACGFRAEFHRPKHKGPRHVVYLGWPYTS